MADQDSTINTPGRVGGQWTYDQLEERRQPCRDLMGGTRAVRARVSTYLPQLPGEADPEYRERYMGAVVRPWFPQAVRNLVGKPFRTELKLGEDVPEIIRGGQTPARPRQPRISGETESDDRERQGIVDLHAHLAATGTLPEEGWAEDIDLQGNGLHMFARSMMEDWIAEGFRGILVEHQKTNLPANPSLADLKGAGRAYFVPLFPEHSIEVLDEYVNGRRVLLRARLRSKRTEVTPKGVKDVDQVRVYHRGAYMEDGKTPAEFCRWELFEPAADGKWPEPVTANAKEWGFMSPQVEIPISLMPIGRPPLEDLADLVFDDWREEVDRATYKRAVRRPTLVFLGFEKKQVAEALSYTSGLRVVHSTAKPGEASVAGVEIGGQEDASWEADRKARHEQIRLAGLEPLLPDQTQTLGERRIASSEAHAALQVWTLRLVDCLELALGFMARYRGLPSGGSVICGEDYLKEGPQVAALQDIQEMRRADPPEISRATAWKMRKKLGVLPEDFSEKDEAALLDEEEKREAANLGASARGLLDTPKPPPGEAPPAEAN
jgi:hypothetical protein